MFTWVLQRLADHGLTEGERIGVDASAMEANAARRMIVRRDSGEDYRTMLTRMAVESGIETPTAEDLIRLDRKRRGKTLPNADWQSPTDPDARIAKLKGLGQCRIGANFRGSHGVAPRRTGPFGVGAVAPGCGGRGWRLRRATLRHSTRLGLRRAAHHAASA